LNANLVLSDTIFQEIRDYQKSNISDLARARENHLEQATGEHPLYTAPGENAPRPRRTSQGEVEKLLKKGLNAQIAGEMEDAVRIYSTLLENPLDNFTLSVVLNHRGMANWSRTPMPSATSCAPGRRIPATRAPGSTWPWPGVARAGWRRRKRSSRKS